MKKLIKNYMNRLADKSLRSISMYLLIPLAVGMMVGVSSCSQNILIDDVATYGKISLSETGSSFDQQSKILASKPYRLDIDLGKETITFENMKEDSGIQIENANRYHNGRGSSIFVNNKTQTITINYLFSDDKHQIIIKASATASDSSKLDSYRERYEIKAEDTESNLMIEKDSYVKSGKNFFISKKVFDKEQIEALQKQGKDTGYYGGRKAFARHPIDGLVIPKKTLIGASSSTITTSHGTEAITHEPRNFSLPWTVHIYNSPGDPVADARISDMIQSWRSLVNEDTSLGTTYKQLKIKHHTINRGTIKNVEDFKNSVLEQDESLVVERGTRLPIGRNLYIGYSSDDLDDGTSGWANLDGGFAVISEDSRTSTFPHEIGHTLGADHENGWHFDESLGWGGVWSKGVMNIDGFWSAFRRAKFYDTDNIKVVKARLDKAWNEVYNQAYAVGLAEPLKVANLGNVFNHTYNYLQYYKVGHQTGIILNSEKGDLFPGSFTDHAVFAYQTYSRDLDSLWLGLNKFQYDDKMEMHLYANKKRTVNNTRTRMGVMIRKNLNPDSEMYAMYYAGGDLTKAYIVKRKKGGVSRTVYSTPYDIAKKTTSLSIKGDSNVLRFQMSRRTVYEVDMDAEGWDYFHAGYTTDMKGAVNFSDIRFTRKENVKTECESSNDYTDITELGYGVYPDGKANKENKFLFCPYDETIQVTAKEYFWSGHYHKNWNYPYKSFEPKGKDFILQAHITRAEVEGIERSPYYYLVQRSRYYYLSDAVSGIVVKNANDSSKAVFFGFNPYEKSKKGRVHVKVRKKDEHRSDREYWEMSNSPIVGEEYIQASKESPIQLLIAYDSSEDNLEFYTVNKPISWSPSPTLIGTLKNASKYIDVKKTLEFVFISGSSGYDLLPPTITEFNNITLSSAQ